MACDHVVPLSNEDMIKIDQNVNDDSALITGLEPFSRYTFAVHQNLFFNGQVTLFTNAIILLF